LVHHGLKLFPPLAAAGVVLSDIRDRSIWIFLGGCLVAMLAAFAASLAYLHVSAAGDCPDCRRIPEDRLKRWYYRAWIHFSRWAVQLLGAVILASMLAVTFLFPVRKHAGEQFNWGADAVWFAAVLAGTVALSAVRFRRVHAAEVTPYTPVRNFFAGKGQGLRHKGEWFYIAVIIPMSALNFAPRYGVWDKVGGVAMLILVVATYAQMQHGMSLCAQCVTEFRTDAAEHAARHTWRFTAIHRVTPFLSGTGLVVMLFSETAGDSAWRGVFYLPLYASIISGMLLGRFHGSYQPWCPYCRRGGGGEDSEMVPDPTGDHGRPLPVG
jgi:hypothetical protein